ncbi:MAG: hypothetical protein R3F38_17370 [Gammaproteobacteria bacterium]
MQHPLRLIRLRALAGALGIATATPALAVLTDSLTIGNAKAVGLGHAVTADPRVSMPYTLIRPAWWHYGAGNPI